MLAPVTNLLELTLGIDCESFYHGRIKHPEKKNMDLCIYLQLFAILSA